MLENDVIPVFMDLVSHSTLTLQMIIRVPTTSIHYACAIYDILKNGKFYGTSLSDR